MTNTNKRLLLGITGGVAAYKSAELCRQLIAKNLDVQVVMTSSAKQFVTSTTMQAVSTKTVRDDLFDPAAEAAMGHIELAKWADLLLIAPATANFIAQHANGHASDLLTTLCLATDSPLAIAPAMNQQMWLHPATQHNIDQLEQRSCLIWGPSIGEQACGDVGPGRMLEPQELTKNVVRFFSGRGKLKGKKVTITAGPTKEAIDPVRFLSNHSSGKMGYALACAAVTQGAEVTLVSGPVNLRPPTGVNLISVNTCIEMQNAVMEDISHTDIFIACAAVSDYRPEQIKSQKMKKSADKISLTFIRNPDILQAVSNLETRPYCVGFAAETENVEKYAKQKLDKKKLDLICANDVSQSDLGFNSEDNKILLIDSAHQMYNLERANKRKLAEKIIDFIAEQV